MSSPDFTNIAAITEDARMSIRDAFESQFMNYDDFLARLSSWEPRIPAMYRESVYLPFIATLKAMGRDEFDHIVRDSWRSWELSVMTDISDAIFQSWGDGPREEATEAFHELVFDLYQGFLSAETRAEVKPPDMRAIPPLIKWGGTDPSTLLVGSTSIFGVRTSVISLPPANAHHGLFTWATLAHETAGHDIIPANIGLPGELAKAIWDALNAEGLNTAIPWYWVKRLDETASDVMGILSMGPASGIAAVVYLRGLRAAEGGSGGKPVLSSIGRETDVHPADILRGYLAASTIRLLQFEGASTWADAVWEETNKDLGEIRLGWTVVSPDEAKTSATVVAETLVQAKMGSLEGHALGEIQNWRAEDERAVEDIRQILGEPGFIHERYESGAYAAHVMAAAVVEALSGRAEIPVIFGNMVKILKVMHDRNPLYGQRPEHGAGTMPGALWRHGEYEGGRIS